LPYALDRNPRLDWSDYLIWIARVQSQAVVLLTVDGHVATWTLGAGQLLGHQPEEIVGRHFSAFYPPEEIALGKPESDLAIALERGQLEQEGFRTRRSGARFYAHSSITALRDAHGQLRGFGLCLSDVSDHHKTEHELRRVVAQTGTKGSGVRPAVTLPTPTDTSETTRRREEHASYLARASSVLSSSLDYETMLRALAGLLVPGLSDWCVVHLLSDGQLRNVASAHVDPAKLELVNTSERLHPPEPESERGVWNVLRSGQPELVEEVDAAVLRKFAANDADLEHLLGWGATSLLIVPLRMRERVSGTISLISESPLRRFDQCDLALAEEIGRRAGAAIENAELYVAERKAREQLELLAKAGETLASTFEYEETLRQVVDITLPALADFSFFDVVEGGEVRRIAAAYDNPELDELVKQTHWMRDIPAEKNVCALSSGEAGFHPCIDRDFREQLAPSPEHLAMLEKLELGSLLTVPLISRSELLGSLTLCFGASQRHHTTGDLKLAEELARRAAIAVVQARLYENARSAAARAEEAARAAEEAGRIKDEFLATVSHELRTPLNAILGWASLLQKRGVDPSAAKGIEVIHRNAQAQGKIIEDILDASRIITGQLRLDLKPAQIAQIARDAMEVVKPSADAKGIAIDFSPPENIPLLLVDADRLRQVIWNLLSNAVKFTDPGGRVTIQIGHGGTGIFLSVADTGRGIEAEFLPHVFERFRQADSSTTRRVGGLGLGLAIVRQIVELHGGQVDVTSAGPGSGATFTMTLPVRTAMPDAPQNDEPTQRRVITATERRPASLSGLRVLVVDDECDARDLVGTLLREAGAAVETAASAAEGFERLTSFRPHVLVSDVGMPDEDGHAFMRRIRALDPALGGNTPSIALTAYTRGEDRAKALAVGFNTHIGKPVNSDALLGAISKLGRLSQHAAKT
jgi:PAS domain S-box-containing protein